VDRKQIAAIKCAYNDLVGAFQAYKDKQYCMHSWIAHKQTIEDLEDLFDFIEPVDMDKEG